jgi:hypothetical protein
MLIGLYSDVWCGVYQRLVVGQGWHFERHLYIHSTQCVISVMWEQSVACSGYFPVDWTGAAERCLESQVMEVKCCGGIVSWIDCEDASGSSKGKVVGVGACCV